MTILVRDVRVSVLWTETALALLASPAPAAPYQFLGRSGSYALRFKGVRGGGSDPTGLIAPWPASGEHNFWKYYLENTPPNAVQGQQAWKHLVPFRRRIPVKLSAKWLRGSVEAEGFHYPHGHALVVTARLAPSARQALPLTDAVPLAHQIRNSGEYTVRWEGRAAVQMRLAAFAEEALRVLRESAFGAGATRGVVESTPYTVVTFVRASGVDVVTATPAEGEVHRVLEAVTSWLPTWDSDKLSPLADAVGDIRNAPPSHLMYMRRRGQAAWFPGVATKTDPQLRSLPCFHRNQVLAALQVESLSGMVREIDRRITGGATLAPDENQCARYAAGVLGRLYGGDRSTYRSGSCRAHVDLNDLAVPTNAVRAHYKMAPLA